MYPPRRLTFWLRERAAGTSGNWGMAKGESNDAERESAVELGAR